MLRYSKLFALLLVAALLLLCIPVSAAAPSFSDIGGHWAQEAILRWSEIGVLSGYPDGTFRPNNTVTRGELATIINNLMHFPEAPDDIDIFSDLTDKWYAPNVNALALQGAYLVTHGEAKGDAALTREEAAVMIYNAFPVSYPRYPDTFSDSDLINPDYVEKVNTMLNTGFLSGFPDGTFRPNEPITRAQVMTILNNMIDEYINEPGVHEGLEGKRVLVAVPGVEISISQSLEYLVVSPVAGMGKTIISRVGEGKHGIRFATLWRQDYQSVSIGFTPNSTEQRYVQSYDARFAGGTGLDDFPYLISNQSQLMLINEYLDYRHQDMHFALANDISLTGEWTPIGYYRTIGISYSLSEKPGARFWADFDGNGYTVNGLSITTDVGSGEALGLFAYCGGDIRNLSVSGIISINTASEWLSIGGVCGYLLDGVMDNCVSHVNINVNTMGAVTAGGIVGNEDRGNISNCLADCDINIAHENPVIGNYINAGGIVGLADGSGKIENCVSHANVFSSAYENAYAGGIIGFINGYATISECQADGNIAAASADTVTYAAYAGGIVGYIKQGRIVQGCVSRASVSATAANAASAGGVAGWISGSHSSNLCVIDSCQASEIIRAETSSVEESAGAYAGGISGTARCANIKDSLSDADVTATGGYYSFAGGITGVLSLSSIMQGCFSNGIIHARDSLMQNNVGGAVGQIFSNEGESKAVRCGSASVVSASGDPGWFNAVGGFAGSIYEGGSATDCYSVGSVTCAKNGYASIAGFVGRMAGSLKNCYTASPISAGLALNDYSYQGLVGTVRTNIQTANCGVFTGSPLHFYDNAADPYGVITLVTYTEMQTEQTYRDAGWDFDDVWTMPDASDSYKLPILQGAFEEQQRALTMPPHLG